MDQHKAIHGDRWPVAWLKTYGLTEEAASLATLYE
jgi:hypothetical protein